MSSTTILKPIEHVSGPGVAVRGNDIDTDRIIPARYMKVVTFEGIEQYVFQDERFDADGAQKGHPFDDPNHADASILVVNSNFGCGSSREHAPQALMRWGIRGIVGESFADIFFGNCVALGVPCVTVSHEVAGRLQSLAEENSSALIEIDLEAKKVYADGETFDAAIPESARQQFLDGSWDALAVLLDAGDKIETTAERLPYISGF